MNLEAMRTAFIKKTSGLGASLDSDEIDAYLNRFYTQVIPADVDGVVTQTLWEYTLLTGGNSVLMPDRINSLPKGFSWFTISGTQHYLEYFDTWSEFLSRYPGYETDTGRPNAILLFGREIFFNKTADADYNWTAECRGVANAALPTDGVGDTLALTIVHGAAWEFLLDEEDHEGAAREGNRYETYKGFLDRQSHGNRKRRRSARSY